MLSKILALLCCLQALPNVPSNAQNAIHVAIDGLHSDRGQVICSLYSSAAGFPKVPGKAVARTSSLILNRRANCEFFGIQPGAYAISVFHDENSNGKLDTNFLGIPREGVGASNDARGRLGPPKFSDAAFVYSGGRVDLKIVIAYL